MPADERVTAAETVTATDAGADAGWESIAALLQVTRDDGSRYRLATLPSSHGGIYGSHLLLQLVVVAERAEPMRRVLSMQTMFVNGGIAATPITVSVYRVRAGRAFAFLDLVVSQDDTIVARSQVTLTSDEPDYLRHQAPTATTLATAGWVERDPGLWPGAAARSPTSSLDAVLLRFGLPAPVDHPTTARALLALSSEPEVMRGFLEFGPYPTTDLSQAPAPVLSHGITFCADPAPLREMVLTARPVYAGAGRAHGDGRIQAPDGRLLATFTTTGALRRPR